MGSGPCRVSSGWSLSMLGWSVQLWLYFLVIFSYIYHLRRCCLIISPTPHFSIQKNMNKDKTYSRIKPVPWLQKEDPNFSISFTNIRDLQSNYLEIHFLEVITDFLFISETGIHHSILIQDLIVPGYSPLLTKKLPFKLMAMILGLIFKLGSIMVEWSSFIACPSSSLSSWGWWYCIVWKNSREDWCYLLQWSLNYYSYLWQFQHSPQGVARMHKKNWQRRQILLWLLHSLRADPDCK